MVRSAISDRVRCEAPLVTGNATSPIVRWVVVALLGLATAGMAAVSLRANYLFGHGLGQTPEKAQVFGWANVATDLWKIAGLIVITGLWRAHQRWLATILIPIWALCVLWGFVGAIGVYAQDRSSVVGGREARLLSLKDAEREIEAITAKLQRLKVDRTVAQVDAAIAAVLAQPITTSGGAVRGTVAKVSAYCAREERATVEACLEIARLNEERAAAEEAERLHRRLVESQAAATRLRHAGGNVSADPVAELFAWASRGQLDIRDIAFGFPLIFAFLIEVVSAFGPASVVAYAGATRSNHAGSSIASQPAMARHGALDPAESGSAQTRVILSWMAERTAPATVSRAISVDDLHSDYKLWCSINSADASTASAFAAEFNRLRELPVLAGKIRKFGNRYYGIRLLDRTVPRGCRADCPISD